MLYVMKWFYIFSVLLFCVARLSFATVVQSVEIEDMLAHSELVFEGRVVGQRVEAGAGKRSIHTWLTFEVIDIIKGDYTEKTIELKFLGGTMGNQSLTVGDMHLPAFGEKGIYFVERLEQRQVHPLYGWDQGHFIIKSDRETQKEQVKTRNLKPVYAINARIKAKHAASGAFNSGTALGVRTETGKDNSPPLSPDQFKLQLRELMAPGDR